MEQNVNQKKCRCKKKTWVYDEPFKTIDPRKNKCKKAGGIIVNKSQVLMVQSCGSRWGFPKGSMEENETLVDCAKREILEETSINLPIEHQDFFFYHNRTCYYLQIVNVKPRIDVEKIKSIKFNDCTGIAWIDINCLECLSNMRLNSSAKEIIKRLRNIMEEDKTFEQ